jgi:septal ring factor EnvC (AmiA/AmiB activator)
MDDFSKLQKINSLARELMKHGQASTMDIAMKMAKQQIDSGMVSEFVPGSAPAPASAVLSAAPLPEVSEAAIPQGASSEEIVHAVERLVGEQQTVLSRMTNVVNSHTNQLQSVNTRINEMTANLNSIIAEISMLKGEVAKLKESPVTPPMRPKEAKQGQTQFKEPAAGEGGSHVRTGRYNPDDVSIEKFFYYGGGVTKK